MISHFGTKVLVFGVKVEKLVVYVKLQILLRAFIFQGEAGAVLGVSVKVEVFVNRVNV